MASGALRRGLFAFALARFEQGILALVATHATRFFLVAAARETLVLVMSEALLGDVFVSVAADVVAAAAGLG